MKNELLSKKGLKNSVRLAKETAAASVAMLQLGMAGMLPIHASMAIDSVNVDTNATADNLVSALAGVVLRFAQYGGIVLMLWGAVMFGFAIKSDEPESKQKALMTAIAGFVLLSLRSILKAAKIIQ